MLKGLENTDFGSMGNVLGRSGKRIVLVESYVAVRTLVSALLVKNSTLLIHEDGVDKFTVFVAVDF